MDKFLAQLDQAEKVGLFEEQKKLRLGDDFPKLTRWVGARPKILIPGRGGLAQVLGRQVADENLVGRIGNGLVKGPKTGFQLCEKAPVFSDFADRLRAIPHQGRDVRQNAGRSRKGRFAHELNFF
jgi:hypothetical protein